MRQLAKYKKLVLLILVVIFLIFSINATIKPRDNATLPEKMIGYIVTPIQKAFSFIQVQIDETYAFFHEIGSDKNEKRKLSLRVQVLEDQIRQLNDIKKENERLREMLNMKSEYKDFNFESAQVIGRNPENWNSIIVINKGLNNGLKVNSVILSSNKGLIGKIIEVAPEWSKVMLITDPESSVSSMIDRTRDLTVTRGDGIASKYGYVKLSYILPDADIVTNDTIITSGFGGIFPKGILIGKVKEVKQESNELTKYAYIEPATDFKRLEEVLIIK